MILGVLFSGVYHIYNQKHSWVIFYIYTYLFIYIYYVYILCIYILYILYCIYIYILYIYPIDSNRCGITGIPASFLPKKGPKLAGGREFCRGVGHLVARPGRPGI